MTRRRAAVLISQLPPGSRLQRARGGPGAWGDVTSAVYHAVGRAERNIMGALGVKAGKLPPPIEPPAEGWQTEARERADRNRESAARIRKLQRDHARRRTR